MQLSANGKSFVTQWVPDKSLPDEEGRSLDQRAALAAQSRLSPGQTAIAISVETERVREAAPLPFDLSTLQEVCAAQGGSGC